MFFIFTLCCFCSLIISQLRIAGFFYQIRQSRFAKSDMKPESNMLGFFFVCFFANGNAAEEAEVVGTANLYAWPVDIWCDVT